VRDVEELEVRALEVLGELRQRVAAGVVVAVGGDEAGDGLETGDAGGAPAPLAGDDDEASLGVGPYVDRVVDADRGDVPREALELFLVLGAQNVGDEVAADLARIGVDLADRPSRPRAACRRPGGARSPP